jgi:hypothetical protein
MRLNNFDFTKNFWQTFPEIIALPEFKDVYTLDSSKNKEETSKIMWCIHLCSSPNSSIYSAPDKWPKTAKSITGNEKLDWKKYKELISNYEELLLTPAEKYFHAFNTIMENKREYLKEFNYTTATESLLKLVETMTTNLYKHSQEYDKVKKLLREEYSKANKPKSLLEDGF